MKTFFSRVFIMIEIRKVNFIKSGTSPGGLGWKTSSVHFCNTDAYFRKTEIKGNEASPEIRPSHPQHQNTKISSEVASHPSYLHTETIILLSTYGFVNTNV